MADHGETRDPSLYKDAYTFEGSMELCLPTCTNKTVTSKHQVIVCGLCTRWFHFACIGLPPGRPGGFTGTYLCLGCLAMLRDMHNHYKRARCKEKRVERLEATVTRLKGDHVLLKGRLDKMDAGTQTNVSTLATNTVDRTGRGGGVVIGTDQHSPRIPVATSVSSVIQRVGRSAAVPTNGGHLPHRPALPTHARPAVTTPSAHNHHQHAGTATVAPIAHRGPRARSRNVADVASVVPGAATATIVSAGRHRQPPLPVTPTTNFLEEYLLGTRENPSPYTNVDTHKQSQKISSDDRTSALDVSRSEGDTNKVTTDPTTHNVYALEGHPPLVPKPDPDGSPSTPTTELQQQSSRGDLMEVVPVQVKMEPHYDDVMEVSDVSPAEPTLSLLEAGGSPGDLTGRAPVIVAHTEDIMRGAPSVWSDPASYMSDEGSYGSSGSASISTPLPPQPGISQDSILKDLLLSGESKSTSLAETESLEEDDYLFCYDCRSKVLGHCTIHPLVILPDSEVAEDEHFQADLSIPKGLSIRNPAGQGAGHGVFADVPVPEGIVFGPYKGEIRPSTQKSGPRKREYCWKIVKTHSPSYTVDASNVEKSNWMRYVDTPDHTKFQNLVAFQYRSNIYYRASIPIPAGTELVVWYGEHGEKRVHRSSEQSERSQHKNKLPFKMWPRDT